MSFFSLCVVVAACTFEDSGQEMGGDGFPNAKEGSPGFQDRCARRKCWRTPSQLMGERNGFASSVPRPMSGRGGDADDATLTSLQGCRGSTDKNRRLRVVEKERGPRDQDMDIKKLRAQVEQLQRQQGVDKVQGVQGESTRRESGLEEDWNMEVAEEVDNKKNLDEQRKRLQKQLREIEKFSDMDQMFRDGAEREVKGRATGG